MLLAGAPRAPPRRSRGLRRRQAPSLPLPGRVASDTVRGQARHPFGFGQVPDSGARWPSGTARAWPGPIRLPATARKPPPRSRPRPLPSPAPTASRPPSAAAVPLPQAPFVSQYETYDPATRTYDQGYVYYRSAGDGLGAAAVASAGVVYPFQPRARYEEYGGGGGEEAARVPAAGLSRRPGEGRTRRSPPTAWTGATPHSLYHEGCGPRAGFYRAPTPRSPAAAGGGGTYGGGGGGDASAGTHPAATCRPGPGPPRAVEPQPPFRVLEPPCLPVRSSDAPPPGSSATARSKGRLSVGSVYRPSQNGRGESVQRPALRPSFLKAPPPAKSGPPPWPPMAAPVLPRPSPPSTHPPWRQDLARQAKALTWGIGDGGAGQALERDAWVI